MMPSGFGAAAGGLAGLAEALQFILGSRERKEERLSRERNDSMQRALQEMSLTQNSQNIAADNERQQSAQDFSQGMSLASNFPGQVAAPAVAERLRMNPMTSSFIEDQMSVPAQGFAPDATGGVQQQDLGSSPTGQSMFATPESERFRIAQATNESRLQQERIRSSARASDLSQRLKTQLQIAGMTDARMRGQYDQMADQFAQGLAQRLRDADDRVWAQEMDNATRVWATQFRGAKSDADPFKAFMMQQMGGGQVPQSPQAPPPAPPTLTPPPSRGGQRPPAGRDPFGVR